MVISAERASRLSNVREIPQLIVQHLRGGLRLQAAAAAPDRRARRLVELERAVDRRRSVLALLHDGRGATHGQQRGLPAARRIVAPQRELLGPQNVLATREQQTRAQHVDVVCRRRVDAGCEGRRETEGERFTGQKMRNLDLNANACSECMTN